MTKTIHTATAPNGQTFTRTSHNRTYSHAVVGRKCPKAAFNRLAVTRVTYVSNFKYYLSVEAAKGAVYITKGRNETDGEYEARVLAYRLDNLERMEGFTSATDYADHKAAQAYAALDAAVARGDYDQFHVIGWAGRPDLAAKLASSSSGHYVDVAILEVTRTTK